MSTVLESKKIRTVLWILAGCILLFVAFGLGITVGYDRAQFATGFDRNYYRIFYGGQPQGAMGMVAPAMPAAIHGVVGKVIDLGSSTISVADQKNNEQSVAVSSGTVIRNGQNTIMIGDIAVGDMIVVIGEPNSQGQIDARFIRILGNQSSSPSTPN